MSVQRRVFPESFKREAVDRVANNGLTAGAVARELGLHETALRRWMTQFGMQATGTSRRPTTQASYPSPSGVQTGDVREQILSGWVAPHADEGEPEAPQVWPFDMRRAEAALIFQHRHLARLEVTLDQAANVRNGSMCEVGTPSKSRPWRLVL